jgi:hypothetical protein
VICPSLSLFLRPFCPTTARRAFRSHRVRFHIPIMFSFSHWLHADSTVDRCAPHVPRRSCAIGTVFNPPLLYSEGHLPLAPNSTLVTSSSPACRSSLPGPASSLVAHPTPVRRHQQRSSRLGLIGLPPDSGAFPPTVWGTDLPPLGTPGRHLSPSHSTHCDLPGAQPFNWSPPRGDKKCPDGVPV